MAHAFRARPPYLGHGRAVDCRDEQLFDLDAGPTRATQVVGGHEAFAEHGDLSNPAGVLSVGLPRPRWAVARGVAAVDQRAPRRGGRRAQRLAGGWWPCARPAACGMRRAGNRHRSSTNFAIWRWRFSAATWISKALS